MAATQKRLAGAQFEILCVSAPKFPMVKTWFIVPKRDGLPPDNGGTNMPHELGNPWECLTNDAGMTMTIAMTCNDM
jgi:hypothetical protein